LTFGVARYWFLRFAQDDIELASLVHLIATLAFARYWVLRFAQDDKRGLSLSFWPKVRTQKREARLNGRARRRRTTLDTALRAA